MPGENSPFFRMFEISMMICDARIGPSLAGFSASLRKVIGLSRLFDCEAKRVSAEPMSDAWRTTVGTRVADYTDW